MPILNIKERNDAAKGKIFTVIGREIAVAVKEGGPDPAKQKAKLRDVDRKSKSEQHAKTIPSTVVLRKQLVTQTPLTTKYLLMKDMVLAVCCDHR